jgi:hypothetical protein
VVFITEASIVGEEEGVLEVVVFVVFVVFVLILSEILIPFGPLGLFSLVTPDLLIA